MEDMMEVMFLRQQKQELQQVLECNSYTTRFGLTLSTEEAKELLQARCLTLKSQERVEFKGGILPKLIYELCDSPYVYQDNYVETLERLQEIFYLYKNECMNELNDDELLQYMRMHFNGDCQGSLDYLEEQEALFNIVSKLSEQYTSGESTSISYEKTNMLMEVVLYCVREARESKMRLQTDQTNAFYNQMIVHFSSYGNQCYYDTIVKGFPQFFLWYDAKFSPQDHLLTLKEKDLQKLNQMEGKNYMTTYVGICRILLWSLRMPVSSIRNKRYFRNSCAV